MSRLVQAALIVVALIGAGWAVLNSLATLDEARLVGVVTRITEGDTFKAEALADLEPIMRRGTRAPLPKPSVLRAVALIRLRQAELEITSGKPATDKTIAAAESAIRRALGYTPSDGFLWYALAWILKYRDGLTPAGLDALTMSYVTSEHEGWVAVHRNAFAISLYTDLPQPIRDKVVAEFRNLVASNYVDQAAAIMIGPGWSERQRLLDALEDVPDDKRYDLYRALLNKGRDLPVPGVRRQPERPWKSL